MASETFGADELKEKQRWGANSKVYTRRLHNKRLKNSSNDSITTATTTSTAVDTATATVNGTITGNNSNRAENCDNSVFQQYSQALGTGNGNSLPQLPQKEGNLTQQEENLTQQEENLPQREENLPQPQLEENLPRLEEELPQQEEDLPQQEENLPQQEENLQQQEESLPQQEENLPQQEESLPQQEENLPQQEESLLLQEENLPHQEDLQQQEQNLTQKEHNSSHLNVVSDDSSSHNRALEVAVEVENGNGVIKPVVTRVDDRVRINLAAANSKDEIRELREKLVSELDQVRSLVKQLEDKEVQLTSTYSNAATAYSQSQHSENNAFGRRALHRVNSCLPLMESNEFGGRRMLARVNSVVGGQDYRPFRHLSVSVMENNNQIYGVTEPIEKDKRTPKANQLYPKSDFLLAKDRLPPENNRKVKSNGRRKRGREMDYAIGLNRYRNQAFRNCSNLLQRLMKHKHAWDFNEPVNVELLQLHDYHAIIKHPMDLGTIKSRLAQNFYKSPADFAEDVRLTFRNAMTYNPKGHEVHIMAEQLSNIFEEKWAVIDAEYNPEWRYDMLHYAGFPTPTSRKVVQPPPTPPAPVLPMRALDRSESMTMPVDIRPKPSIVTVSRTPVPKKPKAKDPNKRDMTSEEKQRLSINLQSLPSEKLDNIIQIIKKRNSAFSQQDDEIELDIDIIDAETLWELDRFVTNYKKNLSKNKRKAEIARARAEAGHDIPASNLDPHAVTPKKRKTDEMKVVTTSPVQAEKEGDNVSSSSSSSSSSSDSGSSSSDSDSDSSSAYGSDAGH